ncbi:MAG TPA: thioredoxin [Spirochaetota bacterium]|nr:thioredoxin [Spirochaetota bacterium]HOL57974.1 thioredoxin [Spirochaetota bacterium]HPP05513.1 thioredoxin [Spirochaetota bacterium]
MSKEIILTNENFEKEVLKSDKVALVDFWASWCGPCRILGPVIEEIANEYSDKAKICKCNVDENPDLADKYQIMSIPTLKIFKNGEIVAESVGVKPKDDIIKMLNKYL